MRAQGLLRFYGPSTISARGERGLSFCPGNPIDMQTVRSLEALDGLFGEGTIASVQRAR
jgi:hypothetical protein